MSKNDFTSEEFAERRERVRGAMQAMGVDWLVAMHPVSIHWLTGSEAKSYQEFQCLLISVEDEKLRILTREGERNEFEQDALVDELRVWGGRRIENPVDAFAKMAADLGLKESRVGMEVPAYYLHPHDLAGMKRVLGAAFVREATDLIFGLKMAKSPQELVYIREAVGMADEAMRVFAEALSVGRTELELAGEVARALHSQGSGIAASPINLVSGERSCFSHGAPTDRRLQKGDFVNIEFGATCHRYTATIGRQFCLGEPSPRMREIFAVVQQASEACLAGIRAGVPANVPHRAAAAIIEAAGMDSGRVHTSGYGLGPGFPPTWAEPVHMLEECDHPLEENMIMTVEPPVFLGEEQLGARLIDNVLVKPEGAERLTQYPGDLQIR